MAIVFLTETGPHAASPSEKADLWVGSDYICVLRAYGIFQKQE